jgi:hypothetical protein
MKKITVYDVIDAAKAGCNRHCSVSWDDALSTQKLAWILKKRNEFKQLGFDTSRLPGWKRMLEISKNEPRPAIFKKNDLMGGDCSENDGFNPYGSGPEPIGRRAGQ